MRLLLLLTLLLAGCGSTVDLTLGAFDNAGTAWSGQIVVLDARAMALPNLEVRPDPQGGDAPHVVARPGFPALGLVTYVVTLHGDEPRADDLQITLGRGQVHFEGPHGDWFLDVEGVTHRIHVDVPRRVERATLKVEADGFLSVEVELLGDDARLGVFFAALQPMR